jgi:hypothetical protein
MESNDFLMMVWLSVSLYGGCTHLKMFQAHSNMTDNCESCSMRGYQFIRPISSEVIHRNSNLDNSISYLAK